MTNQGFHGKRNTSVKGQAANAEIVVQHMTRIAGKRRYQLFFADEVSATYFLKTFLITEAVLPDKLSELFSCRTEMRGCRVGSCFR